MNVQLDIIHNGIIHNNIFISDYAICAKHNKQNINQTIRSFNQQNGIKNTFNISVDKPLFQLD